MQIISVELSESVYYFIGDVGLTTAPRTASKVNPSSTARLFIGDDVW